MHPTATSPRTASHSDPTSAPGDSPYLGDPTGCRGQMAKPQVWGRCSWLQAAEPGLLPASCPDPGTAAPACACCTPSLGRSTTGVQQEHGHAKGARACRSCMDVQKEYESSATCSLPQSWHVESPHMHAECMLAHVSLYTAYTLMEMCVFSYTCVIVSVQV